MNSLQALARYGARFWTLAIAGINALFKPCLHITTRQQLACVQRMTPRQRRRSQEWGSQAESYRPNRCQIGECIALHVEVFTLRFLAETLGPSGGLSCATASVASSNVPRRLCGVLHLRREQLSPERSTLLRAALSHSWVARRLDLQVETYFSFSFFQKNHLSSLLPLTS